MTIALVRAEKELNDTEIRRDYGALIEEGMRAFRTDPLYLVKMAEHAALIAYKRARWEVRVRAKAAEKEARESCASAAIPGFACTNRGACGFGQCLFARQENKKYGQATDSGNEARPTPVAEKSYTIEPVIGEMLEDAKVIAPSRTRSRAA